MSRRRCCAFRARVKAPRLKAIFPSWIASICAQGKPKGSSETRKQPTKPSPPYLAWMVHILHTPVDPPNYYVRYRSGSRTNADPFQRSCTGTVKIKKQLFTYKRPDGVQW